MSYKISETIVAVQTLKNCRNCPRNWSEFVFRSCFVISSICFPGSIFVSGSLDFEKVKSYEFEVVAVQWNRFLQRSLSDECSVMINVTDSNDNAPQFPQQVVEKDIPEDTRHGVTIFTVRQFCITRVQTDQGIQWIIREPEISSGKNQGILCYEDCKIEWLNYFQIIVFC